MALISKGAIQIGTKTFIPASITPSYESLASADSGRTDDGVMRISWVLDRVRKLEITMPPMTSQDLSSLLSLVQGKEYKMTFFDALTNQELERKFYTSNSSADMYSGILRNGLWQNVSFNAIEVGGELNGVVKTDE